MIANIPNVVLDLETLRVVRAGVAAQTRLVAGAWAEYRRWCGIPVGVEYCAVGSVFRPYPGSTNTAFARFYEKYDVDPQTICEIVKTNDQTFKDLTPEERRNAMLDWLDRAIAYASNVKAEVERLTSSGSGARFTELDAEAVAA